MNRIDEAEEHNRLARAQRGEQGAFEQLTAPYARELQLHCYRILGSFQDAEDLLQETLLAAWRGLEQFEARSSLRAWLYTIATNRCLNALRDRSRRPRALNQPAESCGEVSWLQPYPDLLIDEAPGPASRYEIKESVALAFVAGLQHLPPRQRAVLVLRDVLGFHAGEVAEMLGVSIATVTSALQRARDTLERRLPPRPDRVSVPPEGLVSRFADAFERDDIDAVVALLTDDAVVSMPPEPEWHQGRPAVDAFLRDRHMRRRNRPWRFLPVGVNRQPAYVYYLLHEDGWRRSGMFVIGTRVDGITAITRFHDGPLLDRVGAPVRWGGG